MPILKLKNKSNKVKSQTAMGMGNLGQDTYPRKGPGPTKIPPGVHR